MASCVPNLDDGELYLPSTILPDLGVDLQPEPPQQYSSAVLDHLDKKLSSLALSQRSHLHRRRHHHHLPFKPSPPTFPPHPVIPQQHAPYLVGWNGVTLPNHISPHLVGTFQIGHSNATTRPFPSPSQVVRGHGRVQGRGVVVMQQQSTAMSRSSGKTCLGTGFFLPQIGNKQPPPKNKTLGRAPGSSTKWGAPASGNRGGEGQLDRPASWRPDMGSA